MVGRKLAVGDQTPDFALDYLDPATSAIRPIQLADSAGKVRLLNAINSLDTPVCHLETRRWDGLQSDLPTNVQVLTISMDLPFADRKSVV